MDDYISRKVLEDKLNKEYVNLLLDTVEVDPFVEGFVSAINVVKCTANAADVVPVRRGRWVRIDDDWNSLTTYQCTACDEEFCFEIDEDLLLLNYNYCPNCGAKMDSEDDNGT